MTTLTREAQEAGERYSIELRYTRRQLGSLAWLRGTVGLSPAEQTDYLQLVTRETQLLSLTG